MFLSDSDLPFFSFLFSFRSRFRSVVKVSQKKKYPKAKSFKPTAAVLHARRHKLFLAKVFQGNGRKCVCSRPPQNWFGKVAVFLASQFDWTGPAGAGGNERAGRELTWRKLTWHAADRDGDLVGGLSETQ